MLELVPQPAAAAHVAVRGAERPGVSVTTPEGRSWLYGATVGQERVSGRDAREAI